MDPTEPETTPPHPSPDPLPLHHRVVHILSETVNSCFKEIGYHPSLPQRLHNADQHVKQLLSEKTRLHQDNCQLLALLHNSQQSFNHLNSSKAAQVKQFQDLSAQVNSLTQYRDSLDGTYASLCEKHAKTLENFNSLRELHAIALRDITDLRAECARLRAPAQSHRPHPNTSHEVPPPLPPPPPPPATGSPSQQQLQHQSHVPSQMQTPDQNALQLVPAPRWVPPPPSYVPVYHHHQHPAHPPPPPAHPTAHRRSSAPVPGRVLSWAAVNSQGPPPPFSYHLPPNNARPLLSVNTHQAANVMANPPRSSASSSASTPQRVHSASPTVNMVYHHPGPPTPQHLVYPAPTTTQRSLKRKSMTLPSPALSPPNRFSLVDSPETRPPVEEAPPIVADARSPPTTDPQPSENPVPGAADDPARKKPRIEPPPPLVSDPAESVVVENPDKSEPGPPELLTPADDADNNSDDEDSDDEVVEVDAEGLRHPESCVSILMETVDANVRSCRGCHARFIAGLVSEPPEPLVDATMNELIQHCMDEHPAAWNHLRKTVK